MSKNNTSADEKIALQNRLFSLIGVKDGDTRYGDCLIIADFITSYTKQRELEAYQRAKQELRDRFGIDANKRYDVSIGNGVIVAEERGQE